MRKIIFFILCTVLVSSAVSSRAASLVLVSPKNGSEISITEPIFRWTAVRDADYYEVAVYSDEKCTDKIVDSKSEHSKALDWQIPDGYLQSGEYYWRVTAYNINSRPKKSEVWSFTVKSEEKHETYEKKPQRRSSFSGGGGGYSLTIWGGYSTVSMADINKLFAELKKLEEESASVSASVTEMGGGFMLGGDIGYYINYDTQLALRIGYLSCSSGELSTTEKTDYGTYIGRTTIDASLIPVLFGGSYSHSLGRSTSLLVKAFFGYGFASSEIESFYSSSNSSTYSTLKIPYSGGCAVSDLETGLQFDASNSVSIELNTGYRFAIVSKMKADKEIRDAGVKKGDVLKGLDDKALSFDFSGLILGAGIKFRF
ncbi:MAG: hypothetical protein Q7K21_08245 [Elusimicrobiota bacterium]|nr:hypothetical protein [Elusimicrobiota bacterium]